MMQKSRLTTLALACTMLATAVQAQNAPAGTMAAAAQKAIATNPEVTARFHALRAAGNEVDVAKGGFLPRLDLSASAGRDRDRITSRNPEDQTMSRTGLALTASQLLWDGLATSNEVDRLGHARITRYFEFLAASEDAALEASRAYIDTQRYRRLVTLAEDNYVQHKYAFDQLTSKFKAGVGRGVDTEQANARLALAESNLSTEIANLHDVSARYLRIVGEAPPAQQATAVGLDRQLPAANGDAINQAVARNAAISAAVENLRAVEAQAKGIEGSAYQPTVEARARTGVGKNFDGVQDQKRDTSVEVLLNWNLFKGGSDQARVRQYADLINQAADQRDKACRDVRQTAAIAHNDIAKLKAQLAALDRNVLAIEKARDAYRQQFDIGQRSLLDLLNAENELYTARRSYANAEYDLQLAYARTQAAKGTLTSTLGIARNEEGVQGPGNNWQAADDAAQRCPVTSIQVATVSRAELDERARKMATGATPAPVAAPVVPVVEAPAVATEADAQTVAQRLEDWAASWMAKDIDQYFTFYAKDFVPAKSTSAKWINERRRLLTKPGPISLKIENIKTTPVNDSVTTGFTQTYTSSNFKDRTQKVLTWRVVNGQWVIVKESNR